MWIPRFRLFSGGPNAVRDGWRALHMPAWRLGLWFLAGIVAMVGASWLLISCLTR